MNMFDIQKPISKRKNELIRAASEKCHIPQHGIRNLDKRNDDNLSMPHIVL